LGFTNKNEKLLLNQPLKKGYPGGVVERSCHGRPDLQPRLSRSMGERLSRCVRPDVEYGPLHRGFAPDRRDGTRPSLAGHADDERPKLRLPVPVRENKKFSKTGRRRRINAIFAG